MIKRPLVPAAVFTGFLLLLALGAWLLYRTPDTLVNERPPSTGPTRHPDDVVVVQIDEGASAQEIGEALEEAGVIESARLFRVLASLMGVVDDLSPGDYEFVRGTTALTAVERIRQGITASLLVTIPEGWRAEEIADLLEERGIVAAADFSRALTDQYEASFLSRVPAGATLEGFLFPATYGFARDTTAHEAVQQLIAAFEQRFEDDIAPALSGTSLSLHEVVTLASIVEREAQVPEERAIIASVFLNRLEVGLPLQADPTVQYAIATVPENVEAFGYWKAELSVPDLMFDSPYNTYVVVGLPPGPIANPGLDSILAVLEPADTDYLFFVAREDGSHAFAETLEEHEQNICEIDPSRC
jgi:UPF0755 protein